MGIHKFFMSLNDLERIIRCPGRFKFEEHNVAAHSWKVSQYALVFATIEENNGATINWKSLYEKTINHDYGEVFIGDIKTPVKHSSPELKEMIAHVEHKMVEDFITREIPEEFKTVFKERLKEGKDATIEGRLLEFAELKRGNNDHEFINMYQQALKRILKIDLKPSVAYFRDVILNDVLNEDTTIDITKLTHEVMKEA